MRQGGRRGLSPGAPGEQAGKSGLSAPWGCGGSTGESRRLARCYGQETPGATLPKAMNWMGWLPAKAPGGSASQVMPSVLR